MKKMSNLSWRVLLGLAGVFGVMGCDKQAASNEQDTRGDEDEAAATAMTNRVDIPSSVRQNLGITFVKVESRDVAKTLRLPGRFELLPTARREYRAPLGGRVELLVKQYQAAEEGTPLYRLESSAWRDLHEQIAAKQAKVDSMGPLRAAHAKHESSLADKVALWEDRLKQLEGLRTAGGGNAAQFTEARATLNATQAELADVMEKDAELQAQQKEVEAELRSLQSRRDLLIRTGNCERADETPASEMGYTVCATSPGRIEMIGITPGGAANENELVLSVVQPEQIRFRARGMQTDLGSLRDGLEARIAPPQGGSVELQDTMKGTLQIGLTADADERTVDLLVQPDAIAGWARAGVSAHLEITLSGGGEELAVPLSAVVRDGAMPVIFRRDPANPEKVIRMEADIGMSDGRWVVIKSGVKEGDEIVLGGNYQLMLASSGNAAQGGHFHSDGTFHEGKD